VALGDDLPSQSLYVEPERPPERIEWGALECRDVFKIYRSGPVETVALRGLDLRIERGEIVAVLGPSGSGKSTFLSLAAGLDQPSAGDLRGLGSPLGQLDEEELARYRARDVSIVFQSANLWSGLTAEENVALSMRLSGTPTSRRAARAALEQFGLGDRHSQRATDLSGGEQQRVAIAAAAARRAQLLLADEPTGELDSANEALVLDTLDSLRQENGTTVVIVTHSETVAQRADRVIEIRDGRAV
jgi:putative ABC transport system ATP-binding protein